MSKKKSIRTRATILEINERVEYTMKLLGDLGYNSYAAIRTRLSQEFGITTRWADHYIAQARKRILRHTRKAKAQHVQESLAFLDSIIYDTTANKVVRLRAQNQKNLLLGLNAPQRHVVQATAQTPSYSPQTQQTLLQNPSLLEEALALEDKISQAASKSEVIIEMKDESPETKKSS